MADQIAVGSEWVRKRDGEPVKVDRVNKLWVEYHTTLMLITTTVRIGQFRRNFRPKTP